MATVDIPESAIFAKLGDFLTDVLPGGVTVAQGQENRVPPSSAANYVVFWPVYRQRLATNVGEYDPLDETKGVTAAWRFIVQVDVHGPNSSDNAVVITTLWRDTYGCEFLAPLVQPLYADEPRQEPFWNDQKQTENRWVIKLHLQANVTVSTAQQFADTLTVDLIEVDTTYPPGAL